MQSLAEKNRQLRTMTLALGPLVYRLEAHDAWGDQVLEALGAHLDLPVGPVSVVDRLIHLCAFPQGLGNSKDVRPLPARLATLVPAAERQRPWSYRRNLVNTVWSSAGSKHCFWTAGIAAELGRFRYHLPWDLLLHDLTGRGGGLIHGGLVHLDGSALLLLAPPGGGKTTTLATAPPPWQVLSDDAALLWPGDERTWQASPLPSWGMLNQTTLGPTTSLRRLDDPAPVRIVVRLYQSDKLTLAPLSPAVATPLLYRALREYPAAFLADPDNRAPAFRTAAALARRIPCWRLELPLHAAVWPRLETLLERISP